MPNVTVSPYFNLTMFVNIGPYRYPALAACLLLYVFIVCANWTVALTVCSEKTLHEPMYIFVAGLSFNALYGSTSFFPRFLLDLASDAHLISRAACFTQIYFIYTYAANEMTTLCVMAYDRYLAVCHPLRYHTRMTAKKALTLVGLAWLFPVFILTTVIYLSATLPLCGDEIQKVFCANWNVVKLSCVPTVVNNVVGMFMTISTVFLPLAFVLYTYTRIINVSWRRSDKFKGRVFQSCMPHMVSFVVYSVAIFCDIALSRYNVEEMNSFVAIILSLEFVVIPPLLNPVLYGLKLTDIRRHIFKML
ncbi:putative gustatory receptor clone PTE03 [Syngnathoides biaculeatus]|uniref:putative gustatory receptor clone PTE03 n=1 Tax=Syngnathoides biaculeatus TaxID=300417 RepID=UPI002ADDD013|nr:putative gustatory receptor clone PTE03 [Syngnathoides biaculeatus]